MTYCIGPSNRSLINPILEAFFDTEEKRVGSLDMKTDVAESEKGYRLSVELPGIPKENIDVNISEGYLTINAKTEEKVHDEEYKTLRHERFYGQASRKFYLGEVDEEGVEAEFKDGVLHIFIPKLTPEEAKPRKIAIK